MIRLVVAALMLMTLTACGTFIDEGAYGMRKTFTNTIDSDPLDGYIWAPFSTIYKLHGRERLLQIPDIRPKDKDGFMVEDLDLVINYSVGPAESIAFYRKRGDMTCPADLPGNDTCIIGETYIQKDARSVIGITMNKLSSEDLMTKRTDVENTYAKDLQDELDRLYGKGMFIINEVKIANSRLSKAVEERIQAIGLINAEKVKAEATERVLATRKDIQIKEMKVLADVARESGLTVNQILEARRLEVINGLNSTNVVVNVDANKD